MGNDVHENASTLLDILTSLLHTENAVAKPPSFSLPPRAYHTGPWWKGLKAIDLMEQYIPRPFWGNARKLAHQIEIHWEN